MHNGGVEAAFAVARRGIRLREKGESTVKVQVGEVEHPMMDAHYIQLIVLVTEKGYQVAPLTPADKPVATFALAEGDAPVKVYEHCNLHGLWVKEL